MRRLVVVASLCAVVLPFMATALWSASHEQVVADRQASMKQLAQAARTISDTFSGKLPFDAAAFLSAARVLKSHSGIALSAQFPSGTLGTGSAGSPVIAKDRDRFDEIAARLQKLAASFELRIAKATEITPAMRMGKTMVMGGSLLGSRREAADVDLQALPEEHVFHMMLETCSSCHSAFRISKRM